MATDPRTVAFVIEPVAGADMAFQPGAAKLAG